MENGKTSPASWEKIRVLHLDNPSTLRAQSPEWAFFITEGSGVCESPQIISKILEA